MSDIIVTLTYTEAEAREVMRALHYFDRNVSATYEDHDRMNLIRSVIGRALPPPKPDEPQGLGAVVRDAKGYLYSRGYPEQTDDFAHVWHVVDRAANLPRSWWKWDEIDAVEVLSEGVTP